MHNNKKEKIHLLYREGFSVFGQNEGRQTHGQIKLMRTAARLKQSAPL